MFNKMSNSSVQKNLRSKNKACRKNKRCTEKEIKDRITNIACTSFICHLQPPVTTASHCLLDRWWFSVCIIAQVRSIKELECSDSDFTGSVNFSFCAQGRFGGRMREKFMSRRLMLALLVEKKKKQKWTWSRQPWQDEAKKFWRQKQYMCIWPRDRERTKRGS